MLNQKNWMGSVLAFGVGVVFLSGCGSTPSGKDGADAKPGATITAANPDHEGWWCAEHGVPEGICARCSTQLTADFQKKGDWCNEHERPESQCFICHPDFQAKFAAQYEAKLGQKPPKPTE